MCPRQIQSESIQPTVNSPFSLLSVGVSLASFFSIYPHSSFLFSLNLKHICFFHFRNNKIHKYFLLTLILVASASLSSLCVLPTSWKRGWDLAISASLDASHPPCSCVFQRPPRTPWICSSGWTLLPQGSSDFQPIVGLILYVRVAAL